MAKPWPERTAYCRSDMRADTPYHAATDDVSDFKVS